MDILATETGWVLGNWGANGRELPDAAPDIPADTDLLIVMLGTNDLLQGRRPKATAERMERFLTGLELARGKIPLFALPSRVPGGMGAGPNAHCRFPDLRRVLPDPCRAVERLPGL